MIRLWHRLNTAKKIVASWILAVVSYMGYGWYLMLTWPDGKEVTFWPGSAIIMALLGTMIAGIIGVVLLGCWCKDHWNDKTVQEKFLERI